jgi:phenylacetic acid degradation operon negative regulatory protein
MMFTLFGDYIRHRGDEIWVGSLIKIAAQFGLSERAVRSALSRMSQNGWLRVRRVEGRSYYGPTSRTRKLLEEGGRRIFTRRTGPWNGRWHLLVYSIPERKRHIRTELRKQLSWLGYGPLSSGSWICPHDLEPEVQNLVASLAVEGCIETFTATHHGTSDPRQLAARCWDLASINRRYQAFLAKWEPLLREFQHREEVADSECFVQRFLLIHEYRKFFFVDPELPTELLPEAWCGGRASDLFHTFHNLLADRANQYFDSVFEGPPARKKHVTHTPLAQPALVGS